MRYSVALREGFESKTAWRRLAAEIIARVGGDDEAFEREKAFLMDAARLGTADDKRINQIYRFFSDVRLISRNYVHIPSDVRESFLRGEIVPSRLCRMIKARDFQL
jgi:hypothetical protein